LKEYYNDSLRDFFLSLERKCAEGLYEELVDVVMFQWDGKDAHGLDLWI